MKSCNKVLKVASGKQNLKCNGEYNTVLFWQNFQEINIIAQFLGAI